MNHRLVSAGPVAQVTTTPTEELYDELQVAYRHFNEALFGGQLPGCLFTLQRKRNTFGYYSPKRFLRRDARGKADEIAMNPAFFAHRTVESTLSTLVHEMAHQWQIHFGKPSRRGYHNHEWSQKMEAVGLMPSDTGVPGGNRVGQQMTHYIIDGGLFQGVCQALLAQGGMISWIDIAAEKDVSALMALLSGGAAGGEGATAPDDGSEPEPAPPVSDPKRLKVKYSCPGCQVNAWGKPALNLVCGDCGAFFEAQEGRG